MDAEISGARVRGDGGGARAEEAERGEDEKKRGGGRRSIQERGARERVHRRLGLRAGLMIRAFLPVQATHLKVVFVVELRAASRGVHDARAVDVHSRIKKL